MNWFCQRTEENLHKRNRGKKWKRWTSKKKNFSLTLHASVVCNLTSWFCLAPWVDRTKKNGLQLLLVLRIKESIINVQQWRVLLRFVLCGL